METIRITRREIAEIFEIDEPKIRSAKEWRRHQVLMKRLQASIDEKLMRAMIGGTGAVWADKPPPKPRASFMEVLGC